MKNIGKKISNISSVLFTISVIICVFIFIVLIAAISNGNVVNDDIKIYYIIIITIGVFICIFSSYIAYLIISGYAVIVEANENIKKYLKIIEKNNSTYIGNAHQDQNVNSELTKDKKREDTKDNDEKNDKVNDKYKNVLPKEVKMMECPNCGRIQKISSKCWDCGQIINFINEE